MRFHDAQGTLFRERLSAAGRQRNAGRRQSRCHVATSATPERLADGGGNLGLQAPTNSERHQRASYTMQAIPIVAMNPVPSLACFKQPTKGGWRLRRLTVPFIIFERPLHRFTISEMQFSNSKYYWETILMFCLCSKWIASVNMNILFGESLPRENTRHKFLRPFSEAQRAKQGKRKRA